jgi:hypothetical protein
MVDGQSRGREGCLGVEGARGRRWKNCVMRGWEEGGVEERGVEGEERWERGRRILSYRARREELLVGEVEDG